MEGGELPEPGRRSGPPRSAEAAAQPRHHWLAAYQRGAPPMGSGRMVSSLRVCLPTTRRLSPRGSSANGGIRPRAQKGPQRSCVRGVSSCHGLEERRENYKHPLGTFSQTAPPSRGNRRPSTPVPPLPPSPTRSAQTPRALLPPPGPRAYSHKGPPGRSPPSFSSCSGRGNRRTQCFPPIANALGRAGQGSQGGRRPHDPAPAVLPRV